MSFLRICPSKQRVFHHLVKQLRKPDIKLIPSLVSCRYREGMTRKHPAVDSYPSSSLSNSYQPIPISSGYFPVYMYLSIDSRRAESRGRCAIPSIRLCGVFFLFKVRFISATRVNATSFCLNHPINDKHIFNE